MTRAQQGEKRAALTKRRVELTKKAPKQKAREQKVMTANKSASKLVNKFTKTSSKRPSSLALPREVLKNIYTYMVKSRVLEERLIKIYKLGEAFFWIGGPGEEAFGVPLGLLVDKGQGPDHDWLHLHYRCTPTLIAMGMPTIDAIRLIMNRSTDTSTGGRNFSNHYCYPQWNVAPVTSPIEVQYPIACGTAWVQRRYKSKGITIVSGGDAGTAEGDFASCLVWASRRGSELPMLITVQNNKWGISTDYDSQHGEKHIADRGKAFGMRTAVYNGNDPIESYLGIQSEMNYIRKTGKPSLCEFTVSRLYGHSSASGANKTNNEVDCIPEFEEKLLRNGIITEAEVKELWNQFDEECRKNAEIVKTEPVPTPESVWDHVFVNNENSDWRKF